MDRTNKGASTNIIQIVLDVFVVAVGFLLGTFFSIGVKNWSFAKDEQIGLLLLAAIFLLIFILANKGNYVYNITLFYYMDRMLKKMTISFLFATAATFCMITYVSPKKEVLWYYVFFVGATYLFACLKTFFNRPLIKWLSHDNLPRTAFLGEKERFNKFRAFLKKTSILYKGVGYIAIDRECYQKNEMDYIGSAENLEELIRKFNIDQIYMGQDPSMELEKTQEYLDLCMDMGVTVRMVMDFYDKGSAKNCVSTVGTYPILVYHTVALNTFDKFIKRSMDLIGGLVGAILTAPIMLITAIAIKLDSKGPVLFCQTRVGQNGRHFKIYKFRSMYLDAEERKKELLAQNEIQGGVMFKMKNDPRITRVGKIIRKLSIDELPQFFNIIGGSMSLVGTRPPTIDEVEKYKRNQWRRISIKPGLTGMWQVSGRSNVQNFEDIVEMDVNYIDHWSIWLDIKIIFKTVLTLLKHNDAY